MKIFFNTSVTGRNEYEENYKIIDRILQSTGHKVISAVFVATKDQVVKETEQDAVTYYNKLTKWIKESDVLVFEVSYPSLGVGHEITWGLQLNKPTIVLYVKGKKPYILDAIQDEKLQVYEYSLDDIEHTLKDAIDYSTGLQDTRFNFFISPKISTYLDWISKEKRVPRAVYLRRLIEEDMKKNKTVEN